MTEVENEKSKSDDTLCTQRKKLKKRLLSGGLYKGGRFENTAGTKINRNKTAIFSEKREKTVLLLIGHEGYSTEGNICHSICCIDRSFPQLHACNH
jgi:hypothetical protein